jgi:RNA polymerase sigma-70 factor (ECF subfamily)
MAKSERDQFILEAYKYRAKLHAYAWRLTRSSSAADDVLQEVWLRVCKYWDSYQAGSNLQNWLYRIVTRVWFDEYRKQSNEAHKLLPYVSVNIRSEDATTTFSTVFDSEYSEKTQATLAQLSANHRAILLLASRSASNSYRPMAEALGIPCGTVMSRLFRARRAFRRLQDQNKPDAGTVLASKHGKSRRIRTLGQRTVGQPGRATKG